MENMLIELMKYEIGGFYAVAWQVLFMLMKMMCLLISIAYYTLAESKMMAAIQSRSGPNIVGIWGLLQPLADGLKLLTKEMLMPTKANSRMFVAAPILILILSLLAWSVIPFSIQELSDNKSIIQVVNYINIIDILELSGFCLNIISPLTDSWDMISECNKIADIRYGVLFVLAMSSLNVYGIIIGGWASNSKYAFLGALRSAAQMISYEVSISLVILPVILLAGSLNFTQIVWVQEKTMWFLFPLLPCVMIFFISMLAETNSSPFDLPEAEAELVAGYNVEYSSIIFAMFFLAEYSNMILMSSLMVLLFLGGWSAPMYMLSFLPSSLIFALKIVVICFLFVLVRATFPRYSYDQLMDIGWKIFLPLSLGYLWFIAGILISFDGIFAVNEMFTPCFYKGQGKVFFM